MADGKKIKVPAAALTFSAEPASLVRFEEGKDPQLDMVAYSGGIISNHWWWDDLVIDLAGVQFNRKKYPILERHDVDRKIAFTGKPDISQGNIRIVPEKSKFVDTPYAAEFKNLSADGFPYEASIRIVPLAIERVPQGQTAEANGIKLKGPGTIMRKVEFMEASVCVFGYDRNTSSKAFSEEDLVDVACEFSGDLQWTPKFNLQEKREMEITYELLLEKHSDLVKRIKDEGAAEARDAFNGEKTAMENTITNLTGKIASFEDRCLKLEKRADQAEELVNQANAEKASDEIWAIKLSKSVVEDRAHKKIKRQVPFTKFIKDDGSFDEAAFSAAVDAEIKDWEGMFGQSSVEGGAPAGKGTEGSFNEADDDAVADCLFAHRKSPAVTKVDN